MPIRYSWRAFGLRQIVSATRFQLPANIALQTRLGAVTEIAAREVPEVAAAYPYHRRESASDMCQDFDMREYEDQPMGYLLYRVMTALRPQVTAELGPVGLGLPEFVCLRILSMSPDQSSAELARNTNVSPQAMNLVLRGLQEMGAVTRPATVPSGRALPARLTSKGKALLKRADAAVQVAEERLLTNLTPDERREFKRILHAVGSQAVDVAAPSCLSSKTGIDKPANT